MGQHGQALVASSVRNVKPRDEVSREDSTGVSSRMGDELPSRKGGPGGSAGRSESHAS